MQVTVNRNRIYLGAAILVTALALLWLLFSPAGIRVETAKATRSELLDTIDAEGYTRVKNKFTITAPVSGKLKRIGLKEGDYILKDYPITEVDPNPPMQQSPRSYGNGPNPYAAKVFAPVGGRILRVFEKSERFLEVGTPLVEIGDPSNIEIVIDVLSTDAVKIRPGSTALIETADSGEPIRAKVKVIEPQAVTKVSALGVEEKRVDVVADFTEAKPALGDNFRVDVSIIIWQGQDVLSVPNSALFRSGNSWQVFVVTWGRARLRDVEVGHRSSTSTEIKSGIDEGDVVVVHPPNVLSDGSRIEED